PWNSPPGISIRQSKAMPDCRPSCCVPHRLSSEMPAKRAPSRWRRESTILQLAKLHCLELIWTLDFKSSIVTLLVFWCLPNIKIDIWESDSSRALTAGDDTVVSDDLQKVLLASAFHVLSATPLVARERVSLLHLSQPFFLVR